MEYKANVTNIRTQKTFWISFLAKDHKDAVAKVKRLRLKVLQISPYRPIGGN